MLWDNIEDAHARLTRCVVMYDDHPYYVDRIDGPVKKVLIVVMRRLPLLDDQLTVTLDDPKLNYTQYRLGYVNRQSDGGLWTSFYMMRSPVRGIKQGIYNNNIQYAGLQRGFKGPSIDNSLNNPHFADMLMNKYPTIDVAKDLIDKAPVREGYANTIAFHRNFALSRDPLGFYKLLYKGDEVAWGDPIGGLNLPSQYSHLMQVMEENGVKLNG